MKQLPILYSTHMVQANLEGRKTETRKTSGLKEINKAPDEWQFIHLAVDHNNLLFAHFKRGNQFAAIPCPYGQPGDVLWVRETWAHTKVLNIHPTDDNYGYVYKADGQPWENYYGWIWKPSIHMPKAAARILLQVVEIKVERLHDITEESAKAEGISRYPKSPIYGYKNYLDADAFCLSAVESFKTLWCSINGPESWQANPWLWVVKYKVLSTTGKPQFLNQ